MRYSVTVYSLSSRGGMVNNYQPKIFATKVRQWFSVIYAKQFRVKRTLQQVNGPRPRLSLPPATEPTVQETVYQEALQLKCFGDKRT